MSPEKAKYCAKVMQAFAEGKPIQWQYADTLVPDQWNDVGSGGYYWSSTRNKNYNTLAYNLYFHASNKYMDDYNCLYARSIRLVSESPFEGGIRFGNIYWKPKNEEEYYSFSAAIEKWN